jgi:tetratricopeptide (TPR) repeat protein
MRRGFLAFLVLLASASAWAQPPDLERARRHFDAGSQAFQQGDYPRAELEFRGAYAITKDPLLLYNIGQSQQRRGHLEAAIKSYRSYLAGVPDADDRAEVEGNIRSLEKELAVPTAGSLTGPGEGPTRTPTRRSDDDTRARRQSAWIVGSVSVAMLAVGAAMSGLSWKRAVDANKMINRRDAFGQPVPFVDVQTAFNAKKSDAATFGGVAIGMYAAAAVGIGISTYLFISSRSGKASKEKREARLRLVPVLDYHNAGLVAGMEF